MPRAALPKTKPVVGPQGQLYTLENGKLTARKADGTRDWSKDLPGEIYPPLVDQDGHLYLADKEGNVTSLDSRGEPRWETKLKGKLYKPPTLAGNHTLGLIASVGVGQIVNLDTRNGTKRFERDLMGQIIIGGPLHGGPEGNLYLFNSNEHKLHCYEPDGKSPWGRGMGDLIGTIAFGQDGTLFIPRSFGDVKAVDPKTGDQLWCYRPGASRPDINEQLVVRSENKMLKLSETGAPLWTQELPEKPQGKPISDQLGTTFVSAGEKVYALSTEAGRPQACFEPGGELAPLTEGALVSDEQGTVHRLSVLTGAPEPEATSQVVQEQGRIVVGGVRLATRKP